MIALLAATALAKPPPTPDYVEAGTVVILTDVGPKDAFFRQRKYIKGLACGVEEGGMTREMGKWYSGSVTCGAEDNFYFYNVAIALDTSGYDYAALTGHAPGEPMPGSEPSPWPAGARVEILGISNMDAHVGLSASLVGTTCSVTGLGLTAAGEDWFSGQLTCDGIGDYYFFQVRVGAADASGAAVAGPSAGASAFAAGKLVKVADIGPADAHAAARGELVGRTCTVVEVPLYALPDGWFAGRLFCDDGKSWQLLQVKVAAP